MQSTVVDDRNVVHADDACTSSCTRLAIGAFSNAIFRRASVELVLKADLATCSVLRNVFDSKESTILKVCFQFDRLRRAKF